MAIESLAHAGGDPGLVLRPYQEEALAAIEAAAARGVRRALVALPTGTGKTVIFAEQVHRRPGRALLLVHRDELLEQAVEKVHAVAPSLRVGRVKAERDEVDAPVVVASVQTLARPARLARLTPDFATVVVDEAHHAPAETYRRILTHVGSFEAGGPLTLGVTATPDRGDGVGLGAIFEAIVYRKSLLEMIEAGYLADLRALRVRLALDLGRVRVTHGDFAEGALGDALLDAGAPAVVAHAYGTYAADRKALAFTPTVAVAHALADALRAAGVAAEALDGETPRETRRAILGRLRTGATRVVANCGVLTEGFDEPTVDAILVGRPTRSRALYTQMIGRGTRLAPGKADCLILDVVGATTRHDLVTTPSLLGLPLDALEAGDGDRAATVTEAARRVAAEAAGLAEATRLEAERVALFTRARFAWVQAGAGWALRLGDAGRVLLEPTGGERWAVVAVDGRGARTRVADGLDLGYAQGVGEDHVRARGAAWRVDRAAPWRRAPATEKQLGALRRWRLPVRPGLTKGEASDLLEGAIAGAGR